MRSFASLTMTARVSLGLSLLASLLSGCAGLSRPVEPPVMHPHAAHAGRIRYLEQVPAVAQKAYQCGPSSLESVMRRWGRTESADQIAGALFKTRSRGVMNFALLRYARTKGFWTQSGESDTEKLKLWIVKGIPPIAMLRVGPGFLGVGSYHYVVVRGYNDGGEFFYANTGEREPHAISYDVFEKRWHPARYWLAVICPPDIVDWDLEPDQAADLGLMCERQDKLDLARKWYLYSLKQDPGNGITLFNLANVHFKSGHWKEAEDIYRDLLKERPDWAPLSNNLAWVYIETGRYARAIRTIEKAFANRAQRRPDILDTLGTAYLRSGRRDQARTCFMEALERAQSAGETEQIELIRSHLEAVSASS